MKTFNIDGRSIGIKFDPLVIAEIGINHEGSFDKAVRMINDAHKAGCECIKVQSHIVEDEMVPNNVIPANARESIWDIMLRCSLSEEEEHELKRITEKKGMIFLSTPFSRAAADRLHKMNVSAYKIGSGECNNYPLIEYIAGFKRPIILSTGMNNIISIKKAVKIIKKHKVPYAILHCTSIYPTPYEKVRLGAIQNLARTFPGDIIGMSDHSIGIYASLGAVALGASIIEKHFTSDKKWPGPDIEISIDPAELKELISGSMAIHKSMGGIKNILKEEQPTIDFAYASVVAIKNIKKGERFSKDNIWVKRPGTGEVMASSYKRLLGKKAKYDVMKDSQIRRKDING